MFSMDGDAADVDALRRDRARDTARCSCSTRPTRCSARIPTFARDADVLRVGTLSKTLGALGGFVAGPARYVELVENTARPVHLHDRADTRRHRRRARRARRAASRAEGDALVARLRGARRPAARRATRRRSSRSSAATRRARSTRPRALLEHGLLVPAIRPPTVAPGTSRLRVALSAAHTDAQVDRLAAALADVFGDSTSPDAR